MTEVERATAAGELIDVTIERRQLLISPIRRSPSDDTEALKAWLYAMLPRVRITDLLVEVVAWSGFATASSMPAAASRPSINPR